MKKLLSVILATMVLLCSAGALAESVRFVENSDSFDIEMPLPEGATVLSQSGMDDLSIVSIGSAGLATVRINIAPSEIYDVESMNDLSEEEIALLQELAGLQYDSPLSSIEETELGNKFIHICANSEYDVDSIFTLYKGYFIEMTQWHEGEEGIEDYAPLTDADYAFMRQLLYNLVFIPLDK